MANATTRERELARPKEGKAYITKLLLGDGDDPDYYQWRGGGRKVNEDAKLLVSSIMS